MPDTAAFEGFAPETLAFLRDLDANNTRTWFDANRERYEAHLMAPARAFVTDLGAELKSRVSPALNADPRVNGSIFRIHRDTRFSADKTPYKAHLDLMFWEGAGRSRDCPALFFRLTPEALWLGAGKHGFDKAQLARYREAVADETRGAALEAALADVRQARPDVEIGGEHYKRVPKGYASDHARADLLRFNGLHAFVQGEHPDVLGQDAFVTWCAERLETLAPVHRWLVEALRDG